MVIPAPSGRQFGSISTRSTAIPALRSAIAAAMPENPPPITRTLFTAAIESSLSSCSLPLWDPHAKLARGVDVGSNPRQPPAEARTLYANPALRQELGAVRVADDPRSRGVQIAVLPQGHRRPGMRASVAPDPDDALSADSKERVLPLVVRIEAARSPFGYRIGGAERNGAHVRRQA